jgi:hypothetical protein
MMVGRVLKKLQKEMENFEIQYVDIVRHPRTALKNGITMIPTLQVGEKRLSGIFLSEEKIRNFLYSNVVAQEI